MGVRNLGRWWEVGGFLLCDMGSRVGRKVIKGLERCDVINVFGWVDGRVKNRIFYD